ncbi:MAG TPA: lipopolysaccharide biosynthesis protein [Chitinophagaceae bacterium]|nr:lipopolysaccharide biosynthesis protein [Chitinophagaceae bacterium]
MDITEISDIKEKALIGSKWLVIEKVSLQLVQFIVGIILARLLGPKAFGLVALSAVFIIISGAIMDSGFEKALIQTQNLTALQISTAFYINTFLGLLMALIICLLAPTIADFFHAPELTNILRVLSLGLPIDAFGQTQRMLIMKELNFKKISIGQICSALVSAIVGITLAFCGFGVWALVFSWLSGTLTFVLIFWYKSSWYPKFVFSYSSIASVVPFGLNVLASSVLFFFAQQFNNFIVGKYYDKAELGLFNRGLRFPELISTLIQGVVLKMSFPLFSKLQFEEAQLKNVLRKSFRMTAFVTFPLLGYMFINAKQIILFLLTDQWIGAVIYLKIFCLVNLLNPFISLQRELLLAKGFAKLLFRLLLLTSVLEMVPILFVVKSGIIYVAWIVLANKIFQFFLYQQIAARKMSLPLFEAIKWILPYFVIVLLIVSSIQCLDWILPGSVTHILLLKLSIDILLGVSIYFLISISYRLEEFQTMKLVVYSVFKRR